MKLGLKLFSTNVELISAAYVLKQQGIYDFVELYVAPNSFNDTIHQWTHFDVPYIIHAPHSYSGLNLSLRDREQSNRLFIDEVEAFRTRLKPVKIIFHPGIQGSLDESIRQINYFKRVYPELFASAVIENKPKIGLKQEVCVGASPDEIGRMIAETGLGFCLDIGHAICYAAWAKIPYEEVLDDFIRLKSSVLHLSDGDVASHTDLHMSFGLGNFPLCRIIEKIPASAYITIETSKDISLRLKDFEDDVRYIKKILTALV